jgi:DNA-binding NarL/FixJ family response regulator
MHPDVIVVDPALADSGLHAIARLRADIASAPVAIVATGSSSAPEVRAEAFLVGADEYVVKPLAPRDLVARVRDALRFASSARTQPRPLALDGILDAARERDAALAASDLISALSPRQIDIVRRLVSGQRVPAIARDLYLSQSTVRNHLSAIFHRLGVRSQQELCDALTRPITAGRSLTAE